MSERCAFAGRNRDDPEEHRQMPPPEAAKRRPRPPDRLEPLERPFRAILVAAEVEPPQARTQREAERRHDDESQIDGKMRRADPDSDDGLSDRDDDDEPVTLDEVRGADRERTRRSNERREPDEARRRPECPLRATARCTAGHDEQRAEDVERRELEDRAHGSRDAACMNNARCTATTTRYASPNASPLPWNAFGIESASMK